MVTNGKRVPARDDKHMKTEATLGLKQDNHRGTCCILVIYGTSHGFLHAAVRHRQAVTGAWALAKSSLIALRTRLIHGRSIMNRN